MDESVTDEVRRQSILKSRTRFPLQEVQSFFGDEDTVTTTLTRNRRVSFGRKVIKEFLIGSAVSTQAVHEYEQSSESVSDPSDCSGPLDLALNKSCRDLEAEMELSGEVITPPLSFSDTKVKDPEQRQRQFTENCINIAKSVFQDTETELTAIIIGAKPTSSDEDKKNSSCMSFTTLEVSNDFGHKVHHDFMAMRHSEMLSHPDPVDKGRYDFLDHSLGNTTLSGPARQLPRSPRAPIAHLAPWEQENDENIPPAHNSFRNPRTSAFRPNTSEATMEFTCARMRSFGTDEMEQGPSREKSMNLSRANSIWETCDDSVKESASFLDATNDEFIDELLEEKENSSDDTDSSPFHNIQRELANLSNVNQSFREKVQTLPGMLNASSRVLNVSNDSELSFLQTPENDEIKKLEMECTDAKVDWPTPSKGNISVFDETSDDLDGVLQAGQGEDMEFTQVRRGVDQEAKIVEVSADEPLTCSGGEKTKIVELAMDMEKTLRGQPAKCPEWVPAEETENMFNEQTMEFTHCNRLPQELVEEKSGEDSVAACSPKSFPVEELENVEPTEKLENEPTMEFTHCNRFRREPVENNDVVEQTNQIFEQTMDIEKNGEEFPGCAKSVKEPESLESANKLENEPTMEFTHCSRFRRESAENNVLVEQPNQIFELTMDVEKIGEEFPGSAKPVEVSGNLESTDKLENEPTMEFTHCNRFRRESTENNALVEQSNQILEQTTDIGKTGEEFPGSAKTAEEPESPESTDKLENEQTMEFTHCNPLRDESFETAAMVFKTVEGTMDPDKTRDSFLGTESEKSSELTENSEMGKETIDRQLQELVETTATEEKSAIIEMEMTLHEDPTADDHVESATLKQTEDSKLKLANETNPSNKSTAEETANSTETLQLGIEIQSEEPLQTNTFSNQPVQEHNHTPDLKNVSISQEIETQPEEPQNKPIELPETTETEMEITNSIHPVDSTLPTENLETDDTLPADDSLPDSHSAPIFELTQVNTTMDPPLETPVTGLAALSARPSLKQQLQSAAPDSTTTQSELIEAALRSMEITEGSIGGVVPKPMKTMSEEQHMQAIHESTRVITEDTFQVQTENTYTLQKVGEATYTVPGVNVCSASEKRTHSDSPCPGERLKKNRMVRDSGKRMHTESPLPEQSLLKKSRESSTPRAARNLRLSDSLLLRGEVSANLDVSVTLNDITLSQSEPSFGLLPMSLPKRSIVPEEINMTEITMPAMQNMSHHDTITTHMPVVAMNSLLVDESELEVSSTSVNYPSDDAAESDHPSVNESCRLHESSTADANEKMIQKVHTALETMSREETCTWKLLKFDQHLIQVDLPLLATGLTLTISLVDVNVTSLCMTHRATPIDEWRKITREINAYGFETLRRYIQKEEKKIRCLDDVPYSLDFFNHFAVKLRSVMKDAWAVLHGCAASQLSDDVLSFRVLSYPSLISCWVDINLNDLLVLDQLVVQFRHETGRLDERAVVALASRTVQPMLQNFVRATVAYFDGEEAKLGVHTKNPPLLF